MVRTFISRTSTDGDTVGEENDPLIHRSSNEYKYLEEGEGQDASASAEHSFRTDAATWTHWRWTVVTMAGLSSLFIALVMWLGAVECLAQKKTPKLEVPMSLQRSWAQYSPYFVANVYPDVPHHCEIDQVNIIQRHGARFPTTGAGSRIKAAIAKLQSAQTYNDPKLDFLKTFVYDLGSNDLIRFGAAQSFDSGQSTLERYSDLVNKNQIPFVRASDSARVIQSSTNWTEGFTLASNGRVNPVLNVIISESSTSNNTLDDNMCPNAEEPDAQQGIWEAIYGVEPRDRLNANAPGANLTVSDISSLISMCPFETLAKERLSRFCGLFTPSEFDGFAYFQDLGKFYGTGYGNELGPIQGVGYINELIARLTNSPVRDNTQTNRTLDSSPETFPFNRTIYADFSHDNQMIAIYSALGIFRQAEPLDPTNPDPRRTWHSSRMVPFSGRLVTERLSCDGRFDSSGKGREERRAFVRMLIDDALQDLSFCGAGEDGLCELDKFVESQAFARNDGDGLFEKCIN